MEIEVGKEYMCGTRKVVIVHDVARRKEGGYGANRGLDFYSMIGISLDSDDGEFNGNSYTGRFQKSTGSSAKTTPVELRYALKEIPSTKEITMKEVNEKFGYEVKIVEG